MPDLTREQLLHTLQHGWGTYVERLRRLSPEAQAALLAKQGYARLADLLAHVVAWWSEGKPAIEKMLADPNFNSPDYDVDTFNAQAVERARDLDEPTVIESFERMRQAWLGLVAHLPDDAFQNKKIADRLHIEIIGHLQEHEI
jgi:hypothetical protein